MNRLIPLAALTMLAACAESEPASLVAPEDERGFNMVDSVETPAADELELTVGEWTRSLQDERPALLFGAPDTEPLFSIRCDDRDGLLLNRHGTIVTGGMEMMTVATGEESQQLAVQEAPGPLPMLRAAVPPQDDLLTLLSSAQEPIRVSVGDGPPVVMPPSPLLEEFIETCSTTGAAPAADDSAAANVDAEAEGEQVSR